MEAILKSYSSPDISNLELYHPQVPDVFGFLLQLFVGPEDTEWDESFNVVVVSPRWLEQNHARHEIIIGRHRLITFEYDFERLINFIRNYLKDCNGSNWDEVAAKVARLGHWEFEDYKPHPSEHQ